MEFPALFCHYHFYLLTSMCSLWVSDWEGQEHTGEALLTVKGGKSKNKSETTVCLNLCLQDTFVNTPLAQNSHKAKHSIDMQEYTSLPGEGTTKSCREQDEELGIITQCSTTPPASTPKPFSLLKDFILFIFCRFRFTEQGNKISYIPLTLTQAKPPPYQQPH